MLGHLWSENICEIILEKMVRGVLFKVNKSVSNAKSVALNGILLALTIITLFFATIMPTSRFSLYALSSFYIAVTIMEYGIKSGWIFYFASSLLTLLLIPDKFAVIPFVIFFGVYGVIKFYIEKLHQWILEFVLKLIFFNICAAVLFLFANQFLIKSIPTRFPWWIILIVAEVVFILYDYIYTLFVQYYNDKLRKILKTGR